MTVGNHEFDKGSEVLANFIHAAKFPVLAAMDIYAFKDKLIAVVEV